MTRDQVVAMFDRRLAAYDRRDATALAADYTADCVIDSPSAGIHHGPKAAERVLQTVFDSLDVTVQQQSLIIDGDTVAQVVSLEGKGVGQLLGMSPTGKSFRVPGVFLYDLKDGLIARERRIYDFAALLIQTGLFKVKPSE